MTSSAWVLVGFLVAFWGAYVVLARGKSIFPEVPVVPGVAAIAGFFLNRWIDWVGTGAIVLLHVVPTVVVALVNRRELFGPKRDDKR